MPSRRDTDHMGYPPVHDLDERYVPRTEVAAYFNQLRDSLTEIKEDVGEIKDQVRRTNGRVTALELWKARALGATALLVIAAPLVVSKILS